MISHPMMSYVDQVDVYTALLTPNQLFVVQFILVFVLMAAADVCWTKYISAVHAKKPLAAGLWSASIILMSAFTVITYVTNHWLVIAALLGAFAGTYFTVKRDKTPPTTPV